MLQISDGARIETLTRNGFLLVGLLHQPDSKRNGIPLILLMFDVKAFLAASGFDIPDNDDVVTKQKTSRRLHAVSE